MRYVTDLQHWLQTHVGLLATVVFVVLVLWLSHRLLLQKSSLGSEARLPRQLLLLLLTAIGLLAIVFAIPMSEGTRGNILSLLGIVITAVVAFSSTTFIANAMAGLLLRLIKSFRPGDFIRVGNQFGRVSERGLFHTEIQSEDRDLITFPNLYLVTNPVTVVHGSGTIISAELSLGYDVSWQKVEALLKDAADKVGLQDAFVLVKELGDFSVLYRVAGFCPDVKQLITVRSDLRKHILITLHEADIEIASPSIMLQRPLPREQRLIPEDADHYERQDKASSRFAEDIIFDKAESAGNIEDLNERLIELTQKLKELEESKKEIDKTELPKVERRIERTKTLMQRVSEKVEEFQKAIQEGK